MSYSSLGLNTFGLNYNLEIYIWSWEIALWS